MRTPHTLQTDLMKTVEDLIFELQCQVPDKKQQAIAFINNTDLILSILATSDIVCVESKHFSKLREVFSFSFHNQNHSFLYYDNE